MSDTETLDLSQFMDAQEGADKPDAGASEPEGKQHAEEFAKEEQQDDAEKSGKGKSDWSAAHIRLVTQLRQERREAREEAERHREEAARYQRALAVQRGEAAEDRPLTEQQIRQQEQQRYQQEQREAHFLQTCNTVGESVKAAFGDDPQALGRANDRMLNQIGLDFSNPGHRQIIQDISELPNAGQVYYYLAHAPDEASELFNAPERRQYALLDRFVRSAPWKSSQQEAPNVQNDVPPPPRQQVSRAPRPAPATVGTPSGNSGGKSMANMSAEDWARHFAK